MVFIVMTDDGEILGIATNEEIAIRQMIKYITWQQEHNHWFDTEEEFKEAIADIKSNLQADGFIYAESMQLWDV